MSDLNIQETPTYNPFYKEIDFQKGKFYTLPIVAIRNEGSDSFFIVAANGREYAIRMFAFQKQDPEVMVRTELPCMVKDIHGDNIVFVQNFAEMFGSEYDPSKSYTFIVTHYVSTLPDGQKYYDVHDERGVPFRLKTPGNVFLQPHQRINCRVVRPYRNKLVLQFEQERKQIKGKCITPEEFINESGVELSMVGIVRNLFYTNSIFDEARSYLERNDPEWVIKALLAMQGVEKWGRLRLITKVRMLDAYYKMCLYVLEESKFLQQFSESERENFQEWLDWKVSRVEIYRESLRLISEEKDGEEIDDILRKVRNSGYIYNPERKMQILIAIFSMKPEMLEERIDSILDIIAESAKGWKLASFKKAFSGFIQYYILSNIDKVNREAFAEDEHSAELLNHMVRAICYLLLMTDGEGIDVPLFKSMLYHYLSFVRCKNVLGQQQLGISLSDTLIDQAFSILVGAEPGCRELSWDKDFGQTELFAYQMSMMPRKNTMLTTRSYESDRVRFTVSHDSITLAKIGAVGNERNILPENFLDWHNIQLFLDNPTKYPINRRSKIEAWRNWWKRVEAALFEKQEKKPRSVKRKLRPDIGTEVTIRILRPDNEHTNRFYCRIEDDIYQGEGWIDTYTKGGLNGMFHYDPTFDLDSFYLDGAPLLLKAKVSAMSSPNDLRQTYTFDALPLIDNFILENVEYGQESDCRIIYHDRAKHVMLGITEYGYGLFLPDATPDMEYKEGDCVRVRLRSYDKVRAMQGDVLGPAENEVDVRESAEQLLQDYTDGEVYHETADELAEEAMSVSEDQFDSEYITQMICILDHKAVVETDNTVAYGYLSVAYILAGMIGDESATRYLDQRRNLLCMLEEYGKNGRVDDAELDKLCIENADIVEKFPVLKQRLCEIRIVNSFGKQENNGYLWDLISSYETGHIIWQLARLMLSYNMADGFGLQEFQNNIITQIKSLLNINIELPKIYSFGQEDQLREFKSSIVFPPDNGMKPDLEEQTFNIMKVICGMVNAYGGTLYLGVYDTGTAKGLEDDLVYFEDSHDKFDLYVRNQIRRSLGDAVNAAVSVEHPEAGKHWIYAIKVRAAKTPVALRLDNRYYLREGTSTYAIDNVDQLREIMDNRDFSSFKVEGPVSAEDPKDDLSELLSTEEQVAEKGKEQWEDEIEKIPTSRHRSNITDSWVEGFGEDTCCYLRIHNIGEWSRLDDVEWDDGLLTLAIHEDEKDGNLIVVYEDGEVSRIPMSKILKKNTKVRHKMVAGKRPVFISPARRNDALLTVYNDRGKRYVRLDDISDIEEGKMNAVGSRLTDVNVGEFNCCEIVSPEYHKSLKRMHNMNRKSLGFPVAGSYGNEETRLIESLGIKL